MNIPRYNFISYMKTIINDHLSENACIFFYGYAAMKYILEKYDLCNGTTKLIICTMLSAILYPLICIILITLRFYHFIIYLLLLVKTGGQLHSLLSGTDAVFNLSEMDSSNSVILNLLLVKYPRSGEEFYKMAKAHIIKTFSKEKFKKMHVELESFMGYYYYVNKHLNWTSCINAFAEKTVTSQELKSCVSQMFNQPFAHGNKMLWDVFIGLEKVSDKDAYPIVFRFRHCLCDASAIFNIFSRDFATRNNKEDVLPKYAVKPKSLVPNLKQFGIKSILFLDNYDKSVLCTHKVCGDKKVVWFSDDSSRYIDLVKSIKKKHHGSNFVDVVLTAVSASLYNYGKKKSKVLPSFMNCFVTMLPDYHRSFTYGSVENYKIKNKFSIGGVTVPLETGINDECKDLKYRLKMICEDYNNLKYNSVDITFNRWFLKAILTYLPVKWPTYLTGKTTFAFSNIPGCDRFDIFDGCSVEEFVMFDPNAYVSGITVMVTTYDNRLNIAFTFDKSIVPITDEGEEICHDVLKKLEMLEKIM